MNMNMEKTPVELLKELRISHNIRTEKISTGNRDFFPVMFHAGVKEWKIFIEDEYHDFDSKKPLTNLYLVLRALEIYRDEDDFLKWCKAYGLDAGEGQWLEYYRDFAGVYPEIEKIIGQIDSFIPDLDYQLRSGEYAKLEKIERLP